jgi:hypothetical protein
LTSLVVTIIDSVVVFLPLITIPTPRIPFLPNGIHVGTDIDTHTHVMFVASVAFTSRCSDRGHESYLAEIESIAAYSPRAVFLE